MSSFAEDIKAMRKQVTAEVIYTINSDPKLYNQLKDIKAGKEMKAAVYAYAEEHGEFGPVFEAELYVLNRNDWKAVVEGV
jgi:hypothetical protein